jgi:hypothetical protein
MQIYVFLQLSGTGLLGANRAYLKVENYDLQELLLSKTNSIFTGKP